MDLGDIRLAKVNYNELAQTGSNGRLLWSLQWTLEFHKRLYAINCKILLAFAKKWRGWISWLNMGRCCCNLDLRNHPSICFDKKENQENLRHRTVQMLTIFQPAAWHSRIFKNLVCTSKKTQWPPLQRSVGQ